MLKPTDIHPAQLHDDPEDQQISDFGRYVSRWIDITCAGLVTVSICALIIAFSM